MTVITFFKAGDFIDRVQASGHSDYNVDGDDIVCSAVSALVQTAYLAIKDIGCKTRYLRERKSALFDFYFETDDEQKRHDSQVILRALAVGLNDLHRGYPQFIKVETHSEGQ